jgi:hypothetical protein
VAGSGGVDKEGAPTKHVRTRETPVGRKRAPFLNKLWAEVTGPRGNEQQYTRQSASKSST